jgi:hypothetical protein
MWAAESRVSAFCAVREDDEPVAVEPGPELVDQVEGGIPCATDGRMMSFPFAVVFAAADVDRGCAPVAWDAVPCVKVEPDVADLESGEFGYTEAANGSEGDHEAVSVVAKTGGAHPEEGSHQDTVNWEQEGGWAAQ